VLLRAFFNTIDNQVDIADWQIDGKPRCVVVGNMGIRGQPPDHDRLPTAWFSQLESKLKSISLNSGVHWVRVYYAQMKNEVNELEVLLDNNDWGELRTSLDDIEWPKGEKFFSVRLFMVILNK
jgi:hypothetical protein